MTKTKTKNEDEDDDKDDAGSESSVPTSHSLTLSPLTLSPLILSPLTSHLSSPCRGIEGVRPFNTKLSPLKRKEVPWNYLQRTSLF